MLDVGGWLSPEPRATHVVDLMPWETRGVRLNLAALPGERFTKDTWVQKDFLSEGFALPFPDKFFDLVICGQTVEDLTDPNQLLEEMKRVSRAGLIESPSRVSEQTLGVRDRESGYPGHPHHCWIMDIEADCLVLYSKHDSALNEDSVLIPLEFYENMAQGKRENLVFAWQDDFVHRIVRGNECAAKAVETVRSLQIPVTVRLKDRALRFMRRARSRLRGRREEDFSWWHEIIEQSRPYSTIDLG